MQGPGEAAWTREELWHRTQRARDELRHRGHGRAGGGVQRWSSEMQSRLVDRRQTRARERGRWGRRARMQMEVDSVGAGARVRSRGWRRGRRGQANRRCARRARTRTTDAAARVGSSGGRRGGDSRAETPAGGCGREQTRATRRMPAVHPPTDAQAREDEDDAGASPGRW